MNILFNESVYEFQELIRKVATTMEEGQALWNVLQNKYVFWNGKELQTGTFRWSAHVIASVLGGDYLDYYLSSEHNDDWIGFSSEVKKKVMKRLSDFGVEFREIIFSF